MKNFENYAAEVDLKSILKGYKGFLYTQREASHTDKLMIRHFNGNISKELIPAFVSLTRYVGKWLEKHPDLHEKIGLQQFIDWGEDYTIRKFQIYQTSLSYIERNKKKFRTPKSLIALRDRIAEIFASGNEPEVVKRVVSKSFLDDARKTLYDQSSDTYLIMELSVDEQDLKDWKKVMEEQKG